jgi:hypothetical protein
LFRAITTGVTRDNKAIFPVMYGGMTDEDLGAMYDFLMTVPPVENFVERFTIAGN